MKQGMLWYDNFSDQKFPERIRRAVDYFNEKYGKTPELCFVHPDMINGENRNDLPVKIVPDKKVLHNHIWIEFPRAE